MSAAQVFLIVLTTFVASAVVALVAALALLGASFAVDHTLDLWRTR